MEMTVDELAAATGMTVRTTRYYSGMGLLPPPTRRGRIAYYDASHLARLEFIKALQDHGMTLAAIEKHLDQIPLDASAADISVQRALATSWAAGRPAVLTRAQLEKRAGRPISEDEVEVLVRVRAVRVHDDGFEVLAPFETALKTLNAGIPLEVQMASADAIGRHMDELVVELGGLLRHQIVEPFRKSDHTGAEAAEFEAMVEQLRQLAVEAVVAGFQMAVDQVVGRSRREADA